MEHIKTPADDPRFRVIAICDYDREEEFARGSYASPGWQQRMARQQQMMTPAYRQQQAFAAMGGQQLFGLPGLVGRGLLG